ncbi:MAG TPA: hypothetical protein VIY29_28295, partial [Ktedonobacteraceae bacterium]
YSFGVTMNDKWRDFLSDRWHCRAEPSLSRIIRRGLLLSITVLRAAPGGPGCRSTTPIAKA